MLDPALPKGLKILLQAGQLSKPLNNNPESLNVKISVDKTKIVRLYYKDFNKFILSNELPNSIMPLKALWKRSKLFNWSLISLDIPTEII